MDEKKKMTWKAKKNDLIKRLTCRICNNLFVNATTISECIHTFCRECIEDKLTNGKLRACPVCNVHLGGAPLDKLRYDSILDDLRLRLFKPKPILCIKEATKTKQYSRRKTRKPLSSFLAATPGVSSTPVLDLVLPVEPEKPAEQVEAVPLIPSLSPRQVPKSKKRKRKSTRPKRRGTGLVTRKEDANGFNIEQDNRLAGASASGECKQKEKDMEKDQEVVPIRCDYLGKSLSIGKEVMIVEPTASSIGKEPQVTGEKCAEENQNNALARSDGDTEKVSGEQCAQENQNNDRARAEGNTIVVFGETFAEKTQNTILVCSEADTNQNVIVISSDVETEEVSGQKPKNKSNENQEHVVSSGKICGEKLKGKAYSPPSLRPRKHMAMNGAGTSQDAIFKEPETEDEGNNNTDPVWLSLVAAENQNIERQLPQIPLLYLRVTNGNLPVSFIKKYLVKKLSLESEDEVDIWLRDELVCSTQRLHSLVDWWVHTTPISERKSVTVGTSGAEFVMVLYYSRSLPFSF